MGDRQTAAVQTRSAAAVLRSIQATGLTVWVDGGWGVDALLGAETRSHKDLDLIVAEPESQALHAALESDGFGLVVGEPAAGLYRDAVGGSVDVTTVEFDEHGRARCRTKTGGDHIYERGALGGAGEIGGVAVACLSVDAQLQAHSGYNPRDEDRHDVSLLHERFGVALPAEYR